MNSNHQAQQGQHYIAERVAHLETAIDYQGQAVTGLREEMRAGFVRMDAEFVRMHEQLLRTHHGLPHPVEHLPYHRARHGWLDHQGFRPTPIPLTSSIINAMCGPR